MAKLPPIFVLTGRLDDLRKRKAQAWEAVQLFVANQDAHGVMDMGAEIQALERAIKELEGCKW